MQWGWSPVALCAAARSCRRPGAVIAAAFAIMLAGCKTDGEPKMSFAQPHGASVAFESIDGLPPEQFHKLVQNLNGEAQTRRLAVVSRENASAYRVRGYLAAEMDKSKTTISWVWDVFDRDQRRALRISGAESVKGRLGWTAADDEMLQRIAHSSMGELAAFLTSPQVAPGAPMAMASTPPDASSPEAAGIFRIFRPHADPLPVADAAVSADAIPLPPRRPPAMAVRSASRLAGFTTASRN